MNLLQRLILIIGAIVFVLAMMTTPKYSIVKGSIINSRGNLPAVTDVRTATVRGFAVLGATALLFFAFKRKKDD